MCHSIGKGTLAWGTLISGFIFLSIIYLFVSRNYGYICAGSLYNQKQKRRHSHKGHP